jgi:hypothetical protein
VSREAPAAIPADPYAVPERWKPSEGTHLVNGVRAAVDAWRAQAYPGATPTTERLLRFWFEDEHRTGDGVPFRFYFCQREAVETFIFLTEIERVRSFATCSTSRPKGSLFSPARPSGSGLPSRWRRVPARRWR